eukprot:scaffold89072_cov38-Phaeocystis_antarctica.AAC.1
MQVLWTETADTTRRHEHFFLFIKSLGRSIANQAQRIEADVARAELVVHAHRRLDPVAPGEGGEVGGRVVVRVGVRVEVGVRARVGVRLLRLLVVGVRVRASRTVSRRRPPRSGRRWPRTARSCRLARVRVRVRVRVQ